jgi:hypothetical protein
MAARADKCELRKPDFCASSNSNGLCWPLEQIDAYRRPKPRIVDRRRHPLDASPEPSRRG